MKIQVNPSDLTLGDLADIEEHVGIPSSEVFAKLTTGDWSAPMFAALVWVTTRRTNSGYTLEDALKVRLSDIEIEADEDPLGDSE